jgi:EpsI family protein
MIVMLGHISGNTLAVGVDHLIYGWLFFGLVIGLLFWIGARWREEVVTAAPPRVTTENVAPPPKRRLWLVAGAIAVISAMFPVAFATIQRNDAAASPHLTPITRLNEWVVSPNSAEKWRPQFENASVELEQMFAHGGEVVGLFVGYYRNQSYTSKLVSSENVLVKSSDSLWARVNGGTRSLMFKDAPVSVRTAELRNFRGERLLVWHWYWIDGQLTANDYAAKAYTAFSRLRGHGDDSAAVIIYTRANEAGGGEAALERFVHAAAPAIERTLLDARQAR